MLIMLWGLPLGMLGSSLYGAKAEQHRSTDEALAPQVVVGSRDSGVKQAVAVTVQTEAPPDVSGQASGTITSVDVHVGDRISLGQRLLTIDERPVLALAGVTPLYRSLHYGDSGTDVLSLAKVLSAAGYLDRSLISQRFGRGLESAVRKFQTGAGPTPDGIFTPASVAFVPDGFGAVTAVSVTRGQIVSGAWPLMKGVEKVAKLVIQATADGAPLKDGAGAVDLLVGAERVHLSAIAPGASDAAPVVAALQHGLATGSITSMQSDGDDTSTVRYEGAFVEEGGGAQQGVVPSTAVFTAASGRSCLFGRSGRSSADANPLVLSKASADAAGIGLTLVDASLIGKRVLRDATNLTASELARCK